MYIKIGNYNKTVLIKDVQMSYSVVAISFIKNHNYKQVIIQFSYSYSVSLFGKS